MLAAVVHSGFDMQAVQNFTATDPYYLNGIIAYTNITAYTVVDGPPLYNVFTP